MILFESMYNVFDEIAYIYELNDKRAKIIFNEDESNETRLQYFESAESAVAWLYKRGWIF